MKTWIGAGAVLAAMGLFAAVSWSDVASAPTVGSNTEPEPAAVGSGSSDVDLGEIPYSGMSAAEQAIIDRGFDQPNAEQVNDAFAAVGREMAVKAAANAAADQLGTGDPEQGVVP